jgi:hypothetical protein
VSRCWLKNYNDLISVILAGACDVSKEWHSFTLVNEDEVDKVLCAITMTAKCSLHCKLSGYCSASLDAPGSFRENHQHHGSKA